MNDPARLWADPRLVYTVAAASIALLLVAIWLFGRRRRQGRQAGVICLIVSIAFHIALLFLVPLMPAPPGGSATVDKAADEDDSGIDAVAFSTFDPDMIPEEAAGASRTPVAPLPVSNLTDLVGESSDDADANDATNEILNQELSEPDDGEAPTQAPQSMPPSLVESPEQSQPEIMPEFASDLDNLLAEAFDFDASSASNPPREESGSRDTTAEGGARQDDAASREIAEANAPGQATRAAAAPAPEGSVVGGLANDFANRTGAAKQQALLRTGGSAETEAAVEAALEFLVANQRADGAWDPRASGAGVERAPLGTTRGGAGSRAETAITGLALLSLMGAGHTHHKGKYADNVYRGLAFLIRSQKPDGSLAGNASVYEATYCHGMAALAIGEAAAITKDASALLSAQRAIRYTQRIQHPGTGGWRYTEGDPGDLSQLGWQAMVLDAGHRAGIQLDPRSVTGVQRFLRSVRMGSRGGLASYRRGEAPSRTMTAEALATRLLIGERVPPDEVSEAERYLLQQPPGIGKDNYYYWYYATLALHQLQDDAWQQWNGSLKHRLLATQQSDGSWSSDTLWGGYGGTVYTTSMAALCLETYYRHAIREDSGRIARQIDQNNGR